MTGPGVSVEADWWTTTGEATAADSLVAVSVGGNVDTAVGGSSVMVGACVFVGVASVVVSDAVGMEVSVGGTGIRVGVVVAMGNAVTVACKVSVGGTDVGVGDTSVGISAIFVAVPGKDSLTDLKSARSSN